MNGFLIVAICTGSAAIIGFIISIVMNNYFVTEDAHLLVAALSLVLIVVFGIMLGIGLVEKEELKFIYEEREILSLTLKEEYTENAKGSFFIGIGSFESNSEFKQYYCFWAKGEKGFFLCNIEVSTKVEIIETDNKPNIEARFKNNEIKQDDKIYIFVPKGTLKIAFDLTIESGAG